MVTGRHHHFFSLAPAVKPGPFFPAGSIRLLPSYPISAKISNIFMGINSHEEHYHMEKKELKLHLTAQEMQSLRQVALGSEKADLAVINARLVNVYTGEIQENYGVAIKGRCIALVGPDISTTMGKDTKIIDASGKTVNPGLIDGHAHLASWS